MTLTLEAVTRIQRLLAKDGRQGLMMRVGVKGGGCSGFEYVMRFEAESKPTDLVLSTNQVTIICDPKSAKILEGTTLHYTGNLIGGGFQFDNPNAEKSCGCGSSFSLKKSTA